MSDTPQTDECVKENRHLRFLQEDHYVGTDKYTYENPIVFLCQRLERKLTAVTEQRDTLAEALWSMLNQDDGSAIKAGILLRSLGLQSLTTNAND
jgi:hypothetical protein